VLSWLSSRKPDLDLQTLDTKVPLDVARVLQHSGVPSFRQALRQVNHELERARRYQRPLAVTLFGYDNSTTERELARDTTRAAALPGEHALFPAVLASVLRESTRETDIVTCTSTLARAIVVMPETGMAEAMQAVNRLRDIGSAKLACPVRGGFAVFPDQGLTTEELIRLATEDARRSVRPTRLVPFAEGVGY
jgi:hypothetical protein